MVDKNQPQDHEIAPLEEAIEDEDLPLEIKEEEKRVLFEPGDPDIFTLYERWKTGNLYLQPEFQRRQVWDNKKGTKLIESLLMRIPLPTIYASEHRDEKWSVIDGQQRLTWIFKFLDNEYPLSNLKVYSELKDKKFKDLSEEHQRAIKNRSIRIIKIDERNNPEIKYEIFERLNTGTVPLNAQELRNCVYRGSYNMLIKKLSENSNFLSLLGFKEPSPRMIDCELVLRFFAFLHTNYQQFAGSMRTFLDKEMGGKQKIDEREAKNLEERFKHSVYLTKSVFGDKAFHRFVQGGEEDPNGQWEGRINKALFDITMYGFTLFEKRDIIPRIDCILEELLWLMTNNDDFIWSIAKSTDSKRSIQIHFETWIGSLRKLIGYPTTEPRTFTRAFKKQLWETNSICAYEKCGQEVVSIEDAEIDHIKFYWRGGKTIPSNARLVHRYCNRRRGGCDK